MLLKRRVISGYLTASKSSLAAAGQASAFSARHRAKLTRLEIKHGLLDLAHGIHDERTLGDHRLVNGCTGEDQHLRVSAGLDGHGATIRGRNSTTSASRGADRTPRTGRIAVFDLAFVDDRHGLKPAMRMLANAAALWGRLKPCRTSIVEEQERADLLAVSLMRE